MFLPILLAASTLPFQLASAHCVDRAPELASAQTHALLGPEGTTTTLKVSTSDDHSKNSHLCNAEYALVMTDPGGSATRTVSLLVSDDEWDRLLTFALSGFTRDRKHLFGVLTESGKYQLAMLFNYDTTTQSVDLIDLRKLFGHILTAKCEPAFDIIGITETGAIVLELSSSNPCTSDGLWELDPGRQFVHRLARSVAVQPLFVEEAGVSKEH